MMSNGQLYEKFEYINNWCKRLSKAAEEKDSPTISEMTNDLLNPNDLRNPMIMARFFYNKNAKIVHTLKQVEGLDSHSIAQWLVLNNCHIREVISEHNADVVEHMIRLGSPVNGIPPGIANTALHEAVISGDSCLRLVELLLDSGADPYQSDHYGYTPLHRCLQLRNCLEMLRLLISRGITVDTSTLFTAIGNQQPREVIRLLMRSSSDANLREDRSFAELYDGDRFLREDQVDCLLNMGVDPNARSLRGENVLHFAFTSVSLEYLRYLVLVRGVDLTARIVSLGHRVSRIPLFEDAILSSAYKLMTTEERMRDVEQYEVVARKIRFCLMRGAGINYRWTYHPSLTYNLIAKIESKDKWLDLRLELIAVSELMDWPVDDWYMREALYSDTINASYIAACKLELVALMFTQLYHDVTLFDVLTDSDTKMMGHVRNEELLAAFREFRELELFPIYLPWLTERIEQFSYLHGIRKEAEKVLCGLLLESTNYQVVQEIVKYLRVEDLYKLSKLYEK